PLRSDFRLLILQVQLAQPGMASPVLNRAAGCELIPAERGSKFHFRCPRMHESSQSRLPDTNPEVQPLLLSRASSTPRKTCDLHPKCETTFLDNAFQRCRAVTANAEIEPR